MNRIPNFFVVSVGQIVNGGKLRRAHEFHSEKVEKEKKIYL
jgi:hypothetical protein